MAARSAAGGIGADAAIDVAGIEGNVGALGGARPPGPDGGVIEGERGGGGALWAKAEEAAKMQTESLIRNEGMQRLCSLLLYIIDDINRIARLHGHNPSRRDTAHRSDGRSA
jgi:hypothetical protein